MKTKTLSLFTLLSATPVMLLAHGAHGTSQENEGTHILAHLVTFPLEHPVVSIVTLLALISLVAFRKPILNAVRS